MPPILLLLLSLAARGALSQQPTDRCEEITIPMCRGIGYNYTAMPNMFHHDTQEEAGLEVHQFWPLVEIHCSEDLLFFLCSLYAPICIEDYQGRLPACGSVCERARAGCAPIMRQYGFVWPERMDCEDFPRYGDQERLCMDAKEGAGPDGAPPPEQVVTGVPPPGGKARPPAFKGRNPRPRERYHDASSSSSKGPGVASGTPPDSVDHKCACECHFPMVSTADSADRRLVEASAGGVPHCAHPCRSPFFNRDEQTFAAFWIGLWAVLCCASASLTVLTFLIDRTRFRYPERPIIFLSGCYLMVSVGYLVRLGLGHEAVACDGAAVRLHAAGRPTACTLVFLLVYFFGMASSLWWVILTLTWLLAAGLKWGNEAIAGYSQYFHLAAWLVPMAQSIAVLLLDAVDGDPVAGVCSVGNQHAGNLRWFVLLPLGACLVLGTFFLLAGFVSLFRIRSVIRQQARAKADKLEKLMIRIGVFSVLYTVPATLVIGCHLYELHQRDRWDRRHNCPCDPQHHEARPDFSLFMLKYFMCLVVGITSGFWISSAKTLQSWRRFLCRRRVPPPAPPSQRSATPGGVAGCPEVLYGGSRTFKPLSPASHVGQVPSSCGKQVPLSHV